jgi:beta-glucosidase
MEGSEVLQVWISRSESDSPSRFARPLRTLAAFSKALLPIGGQKTVSIAIPRDAVSVWDEKRGSWCCERGVYVVSVVTAPGQETACGEFRIADDEFWTGL